MDGQGGILGLWIGVYGISSSFSIPTDLFFVYIIADWPRLLLLPITGWY